MLHSVHMVQLWRRGIQHQFTRSAPTKKVCLHPRRRELLATSDAVIDIHESAKQVVGLVSRIQSQMQAVAEAVGQSNADDRLASPTSKSSTERLYGGEDCPLVFQLYIWGLPLFERKECARNYHLPLSALSCQPKPITRQLSP